MKDKTILNLVATLGRKVAIKANGSASVCGYHQPKEPKNILERIEKSKSK